MGYERAMYFKPDSKPVDLGDFGMGGGFAGLDKQRYINLINVVLQCRSFIS